MTATALAVPRIIGHRGAKSTAPENTLAGLRQAHAEGATWVEFDVKLTADGEAILMHDETLERTTDGTGPVRARTLAEIQALDAGGRFGPQFRGEKVPTLAEALDLLATLGMGFNLEVKPCPGLEKETAERAVAVVRRRWPANRQRPVFSSFKALSLVATRAAGPEFALGYLAEVLAPDWLASARALGCTTVHPNWRALTRAQIREARDAGMPVLVWTVNEPARARELVAWGADSIITDAPASVASALTV